ncbi:MAG: DUF3727 domain-containing protein [Leptolyngbyaceae bacterium]|jgi:hypothetical protein|nr:DUF3727 domain-containing protein [Leptolyngbyaceae bacterium]
MASQFDCSGESANVNGSSDGAVDREQTTLVVKDDQGRKIVCYLERSVQIDDEEYALLLPVDNPIEVFAWSEDDDGDEFLVDLDDAELDHIFLTARAVLAEQELILEQTALTLTAKGDIPPADEEEIMTLDLGDDEEELESEDFQLLASFFHEDQEYAIYTPLNPLLIFVRLTAEGVPVLMEPEEFEVIRPQLEDQLFDDL